MKLWILLFVISTCRAQFSIQGPSDGHRQAAGLKVSQEKGVEYIPHKDSINVGGFSIQGATDGNSNFQIQGATNGNNNFHIQGATDANANFQIQGPTTGGSNSYIQGAYDANQPNVQPVINRGNGNGRALQYKDPSGLRVNWKSYAHNQQPQQYQQPQYQQPAPQQYVPQQPAAPARRPPVHRPRQPAPQAQPQVPHQPQPLPPAQTRPLDNAPDRIKQILLFQQQIPYINSIPEPYRYDGYAQAMAQAEKFKEDYPKQVLQQFQSNNEQGPGPESQQPQQPQHQPQQQLQTGVRYRSKPRGPPRAKRQAPEQQQHGQPQYRRVAQPAPEAVPNYSTSLPSSIQQILKFQAQIPYDIIANRISYKLDKPYVPQPVQQQAQHDPNPAPAPAPVQHNQYQNQYQNQLLTVNQNRGQAYGQEQSAAYPNYNQAYAQNQQSQVRPVTENQY